MHTRVAGVLLAAGEGSRFGQPKALVELDGQTLAERGVTCCGRAARIPILVVTGAAPVELAGNSCRLQRAMAHRHGFLAARRPPGPDRRARDARPAAAALAADVGAVVVALADQPLVGTDAVARLIAAYRGGASVAVAAYDGKPRNPVLLAREHWPEVIAAATGDQGARAFLRARPELVTLVECGDTGSPDDIDTAADLDRIAAVTAAQPEAWMPQVWVTCRPARGPAGRRRSRRRSAGRSWARWPPPCGGGPARAGRR